MYLTKIELTNFQSHKSTTINLAGGFVCIAGKTRSGKTSVLRALNFLFNDVWSDSFIRTGEKSVSVKVTLDSGILVERQKGNGLNKIIITFADGQTKEFTNFGIQAPVEVKNLLGVFPLKIDADYSENVNIHMQDDPHFLITKSAPVKTKFINRLTRLHIIDSVNRALTKEVQDNNKSLEVIQGKLETAQQNVNEYSSVISKIEFHKEILKKIQELTALVEDLNLKYDKLFILATKSAEYLKLKVLHTKRLRVIQKIAGIQGLVKSYGRVQALLLVYAKREWLNKLIDLRKQMISLYQGLDSMVMIKQKIELMDQKRIEKENLKTKILELEGQLEAAKAHTNICPTCKRPLWEGNK